MWAERPLLEEPTCLFSVWHLQDPQWGPQGAPPALHISTSFWTPRLFGTKV